MWSDGVHVVDWWNGDATIQDSTVCDHRGTLFEANQFSVIDTAYCMQRERETNNRLVPSHAWPYSPSSRAPYEFFSLSSFPPGLFP